MNLVIDIGNTQAKLAVFQKTELISKKVVLNEEVLKHAKHLLTEFSEIQWIILSSVRFPSEEIVKDLKSQCNLIIVDNCIRTPFINDYRTPKTLGSDRIALISASTQKFLNENVLIIDAGTCITFDFITYENRYLGGAISPGIDMRYKMLHEQTANLPLLNITQPHYLIGNSTNNSIHSGVVNGVLKEIEGVINEYEKKHNELKVVLTGGDGNFLSKQLKSSIFANSNFLLEGLNNLLEFNKNE